MSKSVSLAAATLTLSLDVPDTDDAHDVLSAVADLDLEGYPERHSNLDDLDAGSLAEAISLRSDSFSGTEPDLDIETYDPNTLLVTYEDGTILFSFVADEAALGEFTAAIESVREPTGKGIAMTKTAFRYEVDGELDSSAEEIRSQTDLPPHAQINVEPDSDAGTTTIGFEITEETPPRPMIDTVVPGLVQKYRGMLAGIA